MSAAAVHAIDDALSVWTVSARAAEAASRRAQRTTTLDLLHAARRVALGLETIARLEQEHQAISRMLATAAASAADSIDRLGHRLDALDQLLDAAERTLGPAGPAPGSTIRSRPNGLRRATYEAAGAARDRALAIRAELDAARRASVRTLRQVDDAAERHEHARQILARLHDAFTAMRDEAHAALDTAVRAGAALDASAELYEHAQLAVVDVRRDVLPPPSGLPLQPPANVAPIPLVAA